MENRTELRCLITCVGFRDSGLFIKPGFQSNDMTVSLKDYYSDSIINNERSLSYVLNEMFRSESTPVIMMQANLKMEIVLERENKPGVSQYYYISSESDDTALHEIQFLIKERKFFISCAYVRFKECMFKDEFDLKETLHVGNSIYELYKPLNKRNYNIIVRNGIVLMRVNSEYIEGALGELDYPEYINLPLI